MDIRSLRYFVETVRLSSFTQAAESLHLTQSTISKMVRQLEDEVGAQLGARRAQADPDGHGPHRLPAWPGNAGEHAPADPGSARHPGLAARQLTVGIPPMINVLFTPVLKAFRARHPHISLTLQEDTGQQIERQVAAGELEIGMTVLPADPELDLVAVEVANYPIWALAEPGTFQKNRTALPFKALADLPLVLLKDDFALTRSLRQHFAQAGFAPMIAAQSGQWDWLVAMASAGLGVALLPSVIHRLAGDIGGRGHRRARWLGRWAYLGRALL